MTEQRRPETSVRPGFARDDWNARYAQKELLWTAAPNRRFAEEVAGLAPGRALDLACGEGRNAVWLAERGWEVIGVDFSDVALAKATELAANRGVEVDWVVADVLDEDPVADAAAKTVRPESLPGARPQPACRRESIAPVAWPTSAWTPRSKHSKK